MSESQGQKADDSDQDALTSTAALRVEWLSTFVAGLTAVSFPLLVVLAAFREPAVVVDLGAVPGPWFGVYAIFTAASFTYVLNISVVDRVGSFLRNGIGGKGQSGSGGTSGG